MENDGILRFHAVHGDAITLFNNSLLAKRDESDFERSLVFSNRPITINETITVKIEEIDSVFHGPLRIGFTSVDPALYVNGPIPLGRDLRNVPGWWIKSIQLFPISVGTRIHFKLSPTGQVLYGVNDEDGGTFLADVDVSSRLWAVLEAYGSVQSISFVNPVVEESRDGPSPVRQMIQCLWNLPLHWRRNVPLEPLVLENTESDVGNMGESLSPVTTPFLSPMLTNQASLGLCIICSDEETNAAFSNCGHLCMCWDCALEFQSHTPRGKKCLCPICRHPVSSVLRIYP